MPRLNRLFVAFALLVLVPAGVLVHYARRFLIAEESQLRRDAEDRRANAIDFVEKDVRTAVQRTVDVESLRPWGHYRNLFVAPDLLSNTAAFNRSPLYPRPLDRYIRFHFEWRAGEGALSAPVEGVTPADEEEAAAAQAQAERCRAVQPALLPVLRDLYARRRTVFVGPPAEEVTSKILVACHTNDIRTLLELEAVGKGDYSTQKKLEADWGTHKEVQARARNVYQEEKRKQGYALDSQKGQQQTAAPRDGKAQGPEAQRAGDAGGPSYGPPPLPAPGSPAHQALLEELAGNVKAAEPLAALIRTYGFTLAWAGAPSTPGSALVAVRLVDLDGTQVLQGFELDAEKLRALAGDGLARLGVADQVDIRESGAAPEVLDLAPRGPAPTDAAAVLAPSRRLLYGAAGLLLFLATAGLGVLHSIVRGHLDLARKRTDFVAAVSHELKAPLTAIRALAEMLSLGIVPTREKEEEYFRHIQGESERLSRLIANVLDLARLERRDRPYDLGAGDPGEVVRSVAETFRPHLAAQGFAFDLDVARDLPPARFDRDALSQVVANLLDNAAKYTAPCDVKRIAVRVAVRTSESGREVAIEVEDSGIGISEEDRARLFRRFSRGSSPLARGTGGAGLGLAIAKEHVDAHGGRLEVESAPGRGSRFRVVLPAAAA